jgi:FKBP-type peptidyl-prolyl cis-trans isomerase
MASVEQALMGMKVGGCRKVRNSSHLAYRDKDIPDLISPDAVLICEIWLRDIVSVLLP